MSYSGIGIINIVGLISNVMINLFIALDTVNFGDTIFSLFDVFIAIMFFELIIDYIEDLIHVHKKDILGSGSDDKDDFPVSGYSETANSSATEDEIDFSGEILHE